MPGHVLVFDLETQRSAEDVGGWGFASKMGLALAVVYDVTRDALPHLLRGRRRPAAARSRVRGPRRRLQHRPLRSRGALRLHRPRPRPHPHPRSPRRDPPKRRLPRVPESPLRGQPGRVEGGGRTAEPQVVEGGAHRLDRALLPEGRRGHEAALGSGTLPGVSPAPRQGGAHAPHSRACGHEARRGVGRRRRARRAGPRASGPRVTMSSIPPPRSWEHEVAARRQAKDATLRERPRFAAPGRAARAFRGLDVFPSRSGMALRGLGRALRAPGADHDRHDQRQAAPVRAVGTRDASPAMDACSRSRSTGSSIFRSGPGARACSCRSRTQPREGDLLRGTLRRSRGPDDGPFVLDFNAAYNPACAYGEPERFQCPVTPAKTRCRSR